MPGPPAEFTDKTIMIISGHSGSGKSTLSTYLTSGIAESLTSNCSQTPTLPTTLIGIDNLFKYSVLPTISTTFPNLHKALTQFFTDSGIERLDILYTELAAQEILTHELSMYLLQCINEAMNQNSSIKLLYIEGYQFSFPTVRHKFASTLKEHGYRVWVVDPV